MIENTILGHLEFWPLWAVNGKLIPVLSVIGHRVIFLDQANGQDVCYSLGVIPHRIRISREITNLVCVCHSCVTMDTYIFPSGASLMFERYFPLINVLHVDWLMRGTDFHHLRPPLQQPGWYCPRALCWHYPSSHCC